MKAFETPGKFHQSPLSIYPFLQIIWGGKSKRFYKLERPFYLISINRAYNYPHKKPTQQLQREIAIKDIRFLNNLQHYFKE